MNDTLNTTSSNTSNHVSTLNEATSVNSTQSTTCITTKKNKYSATQSSPDGVPFKTATEPGSSSLASSKKTPKSRKQKGNSHAPEDGQSTGNNNSPRFNKHRAQGKLTVDNKKLSATASVFIPNDKSSNTGKRTTEKRIKKKPSTEPKLFDNMAATMAHELSNSTYECMVCWDVVRPAHHTWTCDTCWAVFHVNCIEKWAKKSLEDTSTNLMITSWRCPGCQHKRKAIPQDYFCFCGKQKNPSPKHYQTPHTCEELCKRPRKCPHPCVLPCHPGPCPPCTSMGPINVCFCGKDRRQARCVDTDYETNAYSCEKMCDQWLGCGKHRCEEKCHTDLCPPCIIEEKHQPCYCGQSQRNTRCGSGIQAPSFGNHIGYYACEKRCTSLYDCGIHRCDKECHPCTELSTCPFDTNLVTTCPCGSNTIKDLLDGGNRKSCADPIPTCDAKCRKLLPCGHICQQTCHGGPCSACVEQVKVSCRCQSSEHDTICATVSELPPLCDKVCKSNRNCGRHVCGATCCPSAKIKGKRRVPGSEKAHDCPLECGRLLSCGKHRCMENCHKGPCRPCMESSADDLTCHCGRTRLVAPVRCGTELPPCSNPCLRPSMCGHTRLLHHNCHPDDEPCPPCPVLTSRECVCGKANLKNIPCYREAAYCGLVCDKLLPCGQHRCKRTCHDGICLADGCTQPCTRIRTSCGHPCLMTCHNDTPCAETTPCLARIRASCACGQHTMEITCYSSTTSSGSDPNLECNDLCTKIQRNQRLASALNIQRPEPGGSTSIKQSSVVDGGDPYDKTLQEFYMENVKWCKEMEIKLVNFVKDDSQVSLHFKPMRPPFRYFLHQYSVYFNLATEEMDPDPYRSVAVRKSLGSGYLPSTLLSSSLSIHERGSKPSCNITSSTARQKQQANGLQFSGSLSQQNIDDLLKPLLNSTIAITSYTTQWKKTSGAIFIPTWGSTVTEETKDRLINQWKKGLQNALLFNDMAGDVECCWINATGEVTWSEKQGGRNAWGFNIKGKQTEVGV
ncbi:hypothetical protein BC941DRAFT_431555 [Chlamydoabsidia padenii]|nr:hypothetical protein BC941DRAFT_431555 [Chlamydoabsidia padenii]